MTRNDLIGFQYPGSRWAVLEFIGQDAGGNALWLCECSCTAKTRKAVAATNLTRGRSRSCGCLAYELTSNRRGEANPMFGRRGKDSPSFKHGHGCRTSLIYAVWQAMIQRCTNPNAAGHEHYLDVGVTVCDRWLYSFEAFLEDMGESPQESIHSVDTSTWEITNQEMLSGARWKTKQQNDAARKQCKPRTPFISHNSLQLQHEGDSLMSVPAFNTAAPCESSATLKPTPVKSHKVRRDDAIYDLDCFEDLAGEGSSESAFCMARFDLRRSGVLDDDLPVHGKYDRLRGEWINRDGTTVTTAQLLARLSAKRHNPCNKSTPAI